MVCNRSIRINRKKPCSQVYPYLTVSLVGLVRFAATLLALIARIASSAVMNAYMTRSLSDGDQISDLARANAPARSVNRTDLILSQRKNGEQTQPTRAATSHTRVIVNMRSLPWPCQCLVQHIRGSTRSTASPPPHPCMTLTM
jgi:hypothetical protein